MWQLENEKNGICIRLASRFVCCRSSSRCRRNRFVLFDTPSCPIPRSAPPRGPRGRTTPQTKAVVREGHESGWGVSPRRPRSVSREPGVSRFFANSFSNRHESLSFLPVPMSHPHPQLFPRDPHPSVSGLLFSAQSMLGTPSLSVTRMCCFRSSPTHRMFSTVPMPAGIWPQPQISPQAISRGNVPSTSPVTSRAGSALSSWLRKGATNSSDP